MPPPAEILERVRDTYASCASYRDTGDVVTVFIHEQQHPHRRTTSTPFSTRFARPDRFRFEFRNRDIGPEEDWQRYLIVAGAGVVRRWWSIKPEEQHPETLANALGGAAGVSGGSSHTVPCLLMPELNRRVVERVTESRYEGEEPIDGRPCHRIFCRFDRGGEETWWIDAESLLLRRILETKAFAAEPPRSPPELEDLRRRAAEAQATDPDLAPRLRQTLLLAAGFRTETTTVYHPEIDVPLDEHAFEFDAPKQPDAPAGPAKPASPIPAEPRRPSTSLSPPLSAADILERAHEAYATCTSYRDTGDVVTSFIHEQPRQRRTTSKPFLTRFARPDRFRFEFKERDIGPEENWKRYLIVAAGDVVRRWWSIRPDREPPASLSMALAGATGVSGGSAYTIPHLLMPDLGSKSLLSVEVVAESRHDGEESVDGRSCHRILCRYSRGSDNTLWIDAETFLLRRIFTMHDFDPSSMRQRLTEIERLAAKDKNAPPGLLSRLREAHSVPGPGEPFRTESTTHYHPEINIPIDDHDLAFDAPDR
jgi:hypothetical protein